MPAKKKQPGKRKLAKRTTAKKVQASENKPYLSAVDAKPEIDEGPFDTDGLSLRERQFVEAIVGPAGGNATKAAEIAGYNAANRKSLGITACRLLAKARIAEAISHAYSKRRATPEWARNQLIDLASSSMANFLKVDENGVAHVDFSAAAAAAAIGQIKEYRERQTDAGIDRIIKIHDRAAALGMLLRLHGLLNEGGAMPEESEVKFRPLVGGTVRKPGETPPESTDATPDDS